MRFTESLKKTKDFHYVYKKGRSCANRNMVMYVLKNQTGMNRLGISVSKKVGNSVVRHRLTRLVREGYRLHEEEFISKEQGVGYDIVVVMRVNARDRGFEEIRNSLLGGIHRMLR